MNDSEPTHLDVSNEEPAVGGHQIRPAASLFCRSKEASWSRHKRELLAFFVASRLLVWLVAGLSLDIVAKGAYFTPPSSWLDWFIRWDAQWYLDVATNGYQFSQAGDPTNVVFLPLYPILIQLFSLGGLIPLKLGGLIVSHLCLWQAGVWLWRLTVREGATPDAATLSVAFLFFGPVSFFFSTLYSEALFLLLTIGCIGLAREQRWWWAGTLGALVASTRFVGIVLIVPLCWEFIRSNLSSTPSWRSLRSYSAFACLLPLVGLGAYAAFMWLQFGDPLMYFRGQEHWDRHFTRWWILFARESFWGQSQFYQIWFSGTVVVAFSLLLVGVRLRLPTTYIIHGLTLGFIYISSRYAEAMPRYFSVVFPLYMVLGLACHKWPTLKLPLLTLSSALLSLSVILFVNGYWFT